MAIRGVANPEDMAVLATVAYATAIRRAYNHPKSVLFLDEAAALLKFPALALTIGRLLAIAAKAGIRIMLAAQEIHSIDTSAGGKQLAVLPGNWVAVSVLGSANLQGGGSAIR
jgi:type IV secretory pathway VirB4 component